MARPRKESLDYFPHDTDAANDEKIYAMRSLFGNDGYAFYFILLERIYRNSTAELDVSKPVLMASVVNQVGVTNERFDEMLLSAFDVNLFDRYSFEDRKVITSDSVKRRFGEVEKLREKWRNKKDGYSPSLASEFSPEKTGQETEGKTPQSKVKEIKEKDISSTPGAGVIETLDKVHELVFGKLIFSPQMSAFIRRIKDKGHTDAFIKELLLEAGESSTAGAPSMRYLETIFESWDREGIYTRIEAKARRDNAKQKPQRQPVHFNHAMQLQKENEGRNEQPMDGFFDAG